jgi:hypothetical protein
VRNLAVEAGGLTLFYLIEMAILETEEMGKNANPPETGMAETALMR